MNNENKKMKLTYCSPFKKIISEYKTEDGSESETMYAEAKPSEGKLYVIIEHRYPNGDVETKITSIIELPIRIGADEVESMTFAEFKQMGMVNETLMKTIKASEDVDKIKEDLENKKEIKGVIGYDVDKRIAVIKDNVEEKYIDYTYKPDWLPEIGNKYWDKAYIQGIKRFEDGLCENNPTWDDVVEDFYKDMSDLTSKLNSYKMFELLEITLILCLIYGINPTSNPNPLRALKNILQKRENDNSDNVKASFQREYDKLTKKQQSDLKAIRRISYNEDVIPFSKLCGVKFKKPESKKKTK